MIQPIMSTIYVHNNIGYSIKIDLKDNLDNFIRLPTLLVISKNYVILRYVITFYKRNLVSYISYSIILLNLKKNFFFFDKNHEISA